MLAVIRSVILIQAAYASKTYVWPKQLLLAALFIRVIGPTRRIKQQVGLRMRLRQQTKQIKIRHQVALRLQTFLLAIKVTHVQVRLKAESATRAGH